MIRGKRTWREREAATKRAKAIKDSLIAKATEAVERLWSASIPVDSAFSSGERKAIADACHSIRSVRGGWARGRR